MAIIILADVYATILHTDGVIIIMVQGIHKNTNTSVLYTIIIKDFIIQAHYDYNRI